MTDKALKLEDGEASHTLCERGKGVPKEREVNSRREVCEWGGYSVCA